MESIVFAVRASPDWGGMAADFDAGRIVEDARFMPADNPHFPLDIPFHIGRWNRLSNVSFFACRERMREIAARNLASVAGVTLMRANEVRALVERGDAPELLFYHDDDDWFHPELAKSLRGFGCDTDAVDVIVLPFFRLARHLLTFTRNGIAVPGALGRCAPYRFRYCTNNHGFTRRALNIGPEKLIEHIDASQAGDARGFVDAHYDVVLSATSKSPCSAGWVRELPHDAQAFREHVQDYVAALTDICAVSSHEWINTPLRETRDLFLEVLG